jgi:hypothetical protein
MNSTIRNKYHSPKKHGLSWGSKKRALFRKSKKNSEPTQNMCCESFYAEGYTKEEI